VTGNAKGAEKTIHANLQIKTMFLPPTGDFDFRHLFDKYSIALR
jgi:hypothetical protein